MSDDLQASILEVTIYVWAVVGLLMIILFQVFSAKPLRIAPPRRSLLSLPIVGLVVIVYIAAGVFASVALNGMPPPPASRPASISLTAPAPETAPSATLAATIPASAPATAPAAVESPESVLASQFVAIFAQFLALAPFLLAVPSLFPKGFTGLGLSPSQLKKGLLFGFMAFLITFGILQCAAIFTEFLIEHFRHDRPIDIHPTFVALRQSPPVIERLGFFLLAGILAPIAEELFFRGIFQTTLIQRGWGFFIPQISPDLMNQFRQDVARDPASSPRGSLQHTDFSPPPITPDPASSTTRPVQPSPLHRLAAITIVSLSFAYLHQSDHSLIIFLLSFALGYLYERTGNLWSSIALHALFNSISIIPTLVNPHLIPGS